MRALILRRSSTKAERVFVEILKRNHIPFRHHVKIDGLEIDFTVGNYAIEIDGHVQKTARNTKLFTNGWIPIHYQNSALRNNLQTVENDIVNKYGLFASRSGSVKGRRSR